MGDGKMMDAMFKAYSAVIMIDILEVQEAHTLLKSMGISREEVDSAMMFIHESLNDDSFNSEMKKRAIAGFSEVIQEAIKSVEIAKAYQEMSNLNSSEEDLWGKEKSVGLNLRWDDEEEVLKQA